MSSSEAPERVRETHSVPRNLDTASLSSSFRRNSMNRITSLAGKAEDTEKTSTKMGAFRHSTSVNLARALKWNRSKEVAKEVDSSSLMMKRTQKLSVKLLSPQFSLKSKAMLDLATLCWIGGKPVQDLVSKEGGLAEAMRVLSVRAEGFVEPEDRRGSQKLQGAKPRRRRLSLESIRVNSQQKRALKAATVEPSVVIAALGLLETLCSGHDQNQKDLIELGYLGIYEKLMRTSDNVAEKVWATHCTLLLVLNNPQAQSRFAFAYNTSLKPLLKAISHEDCWHTWHYNAAQQLITLEEEFTKAL